MSRVSNSILLRMLVVFAIWIAGCVGGSTVEQSDVTSERPQIEARTEPQTVEQQTRTFRVSVDGIERGAMTMLLAKQSDGTETMHGQAELSFNFIVYKYRYSSSGTEVWKSGRLIEFANEANHNGDKYVVQASAQQHDLAIEVNGESRNTEADVWVTSYWSEPDSRKIGQQIALLTADKGQLLTGTLQCVGPEQITIAENSVNATRYQIRGDVEVDLWYDDEHRLTRQSAQESGHRVLMELTRKSATSPLECGD